MCKIPTAYSDLCLHYSNCARIWFQQWLTHFPRPNQSTPKEISPKHSYCDCDAAHSADPDNQWRFPPSNRTETVMPRIAPTLIIDGVSPIYMKVCLSLEDIQESPLAKEPVRLANLKMRVKDLEDVVSRFKESKVQVTSA
ncbi:hypothetical protein DVH24_039137 [Malus domestica]|uniref:Uncharacterized protein n=1 Tax=Malus domestica TaxID=3750 RepID=A0A498KH95_MALDO|nr:hypothetical protein DVH24_039137 [Malus domestica]